MRKFIPKVSVLLMLLLGSVLYAQTEEITKTTEAIPVAKDTVGDSNLRDVPWYVERYRISAGFYEMINKTNITIQGSSNQGSGLNFERDLGIDKTNETFYADFEWRSSSRSRFNLNYFNSRRKSSRTLDKDITIGDETYAINTNLNTTIETDFFRLSYGYAILSKPKYEVGLLVGTHTITTKIGIKVEGESVGFEKNKTYDAVAPLVDFGVWGGYAFTDRFALRGEINYFQLKIDTFDGRTFGYNVSAVYRVWKKLDLSLGYAGLDLNVNFDTENVNYDVDWGHSGVMLYASYSLGNKKWR